MRRWLSIILLRLREARGRLRASARPLIQAALAAPLAWWVATKGFGHDQPIFAPIASLVAIGATIAQPWRQAVEIVVGVAIGVGIADGLALVIGQGTWQIGVIVLLVMGTLVALGGAPTFVIQGGTAAVLVASLPTADGIESFERVLNTLIGGGAALILTVVVLPVRPLRIAQRAARPVLLELASTFEMVGQALRENSFALADEALGRARRTGDHWAQLNEAVGVGKQAVRIAPVRMHEQPELLDLAQAVTQLDYAIRNARVLARTALRLTETGFISGARLELSMLEFAAASRALQGHLDGAYDETLVVRNCAARAVRLAASTVEDDDDIVYTHFVGQVRSTAVDILRVTGMARNDAITMMLAAVEEGLASRPSDEDIDPLLAPA